MKFLKPQFLNENLGRQLSTFVISYQKKHANLKGRSILLRCLSSDSLSSRSWLPGSLLCFRRTSHVQNIKVGHVTCLSIFIRFSFVGMVRLEMMYLGLATKMAFISLPGYRSVLRELRGGKQGGAVVPFTDRILLN